MKIGLYAFVYICKKRLCNVNLIKVLQLMRDPRLIRSPCFARAVHSSVKSFIDLMGKNIIALDIEES